MLVGQQGAVEGAFEVGLGVGAAEEVLAGADLADGVHRLTVVRGNAAAEEHLHHRRLVGNGGWLSTRKDNAGIG